MKKYLFRFLTLALIVPALASCSGQLEDNLPLAKKHTVYFSTVVDGQATRTGLAIDGNNVVPDWRSTDPEDVHLFEMNGTENALLGKAESVNSDDNDLVAHFKADFEEEITIIVTPPSNPDPDGDGAKVLRQGSNTYGAVVAKSKEVEGKTVFYIPAVQTPDAATLKDPGAEFLVGYSRDSYDAITLDEEGTVVDLYFDRVAALSRIGFTAFQGENEKVKSVTINSESSLTGSVISSDLAFGNPNSVTWTPDTGEGAGVLTLSYGDAGVSPENGVFYAYFVSRPGTFTISSIVVETDQYRYTKAYADGKSLTFDLTKLANLSMDLATAEKEKIASNVWYKASVLEAGYDYIIVSEGQALKNDEGATAAVAVTPEDGIISFESATDPTIIWRATEHVVVADNTTAGHFTLSNSGVYLQRKSNQSTQTIILGEMPSTEKYAVWDYGNDYLWHVTASSSTAYDYYCYYNSGWKTSSATSGSTPGSSIKTVQIYTTRAPQEPGFDPTGPFTFDIDQFDVNPDADFNEPELINYYGDVTYSSSNESIATVDPASGDVTVLKAGTVEITATAAGDDKHQAASASYIINITTSKTRVYNKVTSTADLEDGAQYILVYETASKAFKPILHSGGTYFTKGTDNALDVTISNGVIESPDLEDCHITLENGYYLYIASAGKYLYPGASGDSALGAEDKTSGHTVAISFSEGIVTIARTSDSSYHLYWSSSSYFSGISNTGSSYAANICLYKLEDNRPAWTMSFSPTAATYDLYTKEWNPGTPALTSDATTTITYTSSDESVATVDANGVVTPLKKGTPTISAAAAADATHKRTVVSYELTVEDSTPAKVYTRVDSDSDLEVDANYLIVYEDGSKVFKPILASSTSTTFTAGTDNALSATISNKTITSNDFVDCELTLEDGYYFYVESADKYLYSSASGLGAENPKDSGHSISISISNGTATISRTSNSRTYNLRYSSSSSYFQSSTSSANIALYKLEDNRPAWTMSYSLAEASYDLYTKEWTPGTPVLTSDATTTVTYTSSDESVATVDANGVVTPLKKGTATISAAAAADATHKRTVASYELTVEDSSPAKEYVRVESAADLEVGAKYLIVYESGSYVFKPYLESGSTTVFAKATDNKEAVTISDHKIVSNALDDWQITLETGYYLYVNSASKYLYPASSSGTALNAESSPTKAISISISNGIASIQNNSQYIYYSTKSNWFSSTGTAGNANTALYKLDDGRIAQSISFSKSSAEYDLGTLSWTDPKPIIDLTGVHTTVTYESSDPTVATVTNDGDVTPLKKGSTKITAKAEGNATYKPAEASYTLTVKNSAQTAVYYTKVNSRDDLPGSSQTSATGNYIFVYESGNKAYVFKAICDGTPTGAGNAQNANGHVELTKSGSAIEVALSDDGIEATDDVIACQLQLAHHSTASRNDWNIKPVSLGTYWIRVYNDGSSVRILAMTSAGYSGTFTFEGSGNNLEVKRTDSSRNAYWSYNATNNCFEATSTASKISIYKLEDSSNP